jgi:uncharacterized protein with FMN-binding domain
MKKLLFSLGIIILFTFYVILSNQKSVPRTALPQTTYPVNGLSGNQTSSSSSSTISSESSSGSTIPPTATSIPTVVQTGAYKDGTYDGSIANAFYGKVQVAAVIQNGKLSDVQLLQYPNDSGHSTEVSNSALPTLEQEAIQSQSANVDIVSGATQTSQAFQQSLITALNQAAN